MWSWSFLSAQNPLSLAPSDWRTGRVSKFINIRYLCPKTCKIFAILNILSQCGKYLKLSDSTKLFSLNCLLLFYSGFSHLILYGWLRAKSVWTLSLCLAVYSSSILLLENLATVSIDSRNQLFDLQIHKLTLFFYFGFIGISDGY